MNLFPEQQGIIWTNNLSYPFTLKALRRETLWQTIEMKHHTIGICLPVCLYCIIKAIEPNQPLANLYGIVLKTSGNHMSQKSLIILSTLITNQEDNMTNHTNEAPGDCNNMFALPMYLCCWWLVYYWHEQKIVRQIKKLNITIVKSTISLYFKSSHSRKAAK